MAPSTAPISDSDIVDVITVLQADGVTLSAERVYREVRVRQMPCRRSRIQAVFRAWSQQHETPPVAPCPVAPSLPPPVSHLVHLCEQVGQLDEAWRVMERAQHQLQQQRAQAHADFRNGVLDAARLARRLRQAEAQAGSPVSMMQPDAAQQRAQLRADLAALVGAAEVEQVLADAGYRPWWLEG